LATKNHGGWSRRNIGDYLAFNYNSGWFSVDSYAIDSKGGWIARKSIDCLGGVSTSITVVIVVVVVVSASIAIVSRISISSIIVYTVIWVFTVGNEILDNIQNCCPKFAVIRRGICRSIGGVTFIIASVSTCVNWIDMLWRVWCESGRKDR
jgi:hypothetical protein